MIKRLFSPTSGVSNIELFYDLIFVYCISVVTGMMHHPEGGFPSAFTYATYAFSFLVVLQIWFFTTFLLNRYGDGGAADNTCLFVNMFLLYFLAACIGSSNWMKSFHVFNVVWALLLIDIAVHWGLKRFRYTNLDECDKAIMNRTIVVLVIQASIALLAAQLPDGIGEYVSGFAFLFGWMMFLQSRRFAKKPARFGHLAERCALLVIVTFGETIVAIAGYMAGDAPITYAAFVFLMVVGLFLIYFYEHDNMLNHQHTSNGISYMMLTVWIVFIVNNITVALEYMPDDGVFFLPKSIYITASLVLYLLTSFLVAHYNKPQFKVTTPYAASRVVACAIIIVVSVATGFNPLLGLICDTLVVFGALLAEHLLYRRRTALVEAAVRMGYDEDETARHLSKAVGTRAGRRELREMIGAHRSQSDQD